MKIIATLLINAFLSGVQLVNAQTQSTWQMSPRALNVGDTVPDIEFSNVVNYKAKTIHLSDFKGKAIILDFWAVWCAPCVGAFPKMEEIQRQNADQLQIILISRDYESKVIDFYKKAEILTLPSDIIDPNEKLTFIEKLFAHAAIPHYVWIDKSKRIAAITAEVNENNVHSFLTGGYIKLDTKNDSLQLTDLSGTVIDSIQRIAGGHISQISVYPKIVYQSMITHNDPRLTKRTGRSRLSDSYRSFDITGASIIHLYDDAFWDIFGPDGINSRQKTIVEIRDSTTDYPLSADLDDYRSWEAQYAYSYRLIMPKRTGDSAFYRTMQRDITNYFGYKASFQVRKIKCWVLKSRTKENVLATKGGTNVEDASAYFITIKNEPVGALIAQLYKYSSLVHQSNWRSPLLPILDETAWSGNIDIDLRANLRDINAVKNALIKNGLELIETERERKVLVISE